LNSVDVVAVGVWRKCDASFCNLDFALLIVERITDCTMLRITKNGEAFENRSREGRMATTSMICWRLEPSRTSPLVGSLTEASYRPGGWE